jgi:hypothetical protein
MPACGATAAAFACERLRALPCLLLPSAAVVLVAAAACPVPAAAPLHDCASACAAVYGVRVAALD